jgi:SsrA-binding protein
MKIITKNKKAHFNYHILETLEAGIVLTGDEIKSIRQGTVSLDESFATIKDGEVFLLNCFIAPYSHAYKKGDTSRQTRKLLLKKREINKLIGEVSRKGITLIPTIMYFGIRGHVKVEIGLAKHKNDRSKKQEIKERDLEREARKEIRSKY